MSRIAKEPVALPTGVNVSIDGQSVVVKGKLGELSWVIHDDVKITEADGELRLFSDSSEKKTVALVGTTRALINNMVTGVSAGFSKRLVLVGVGYRAQIQNNKLQLSLGFSHPVVVDIPDAIQVDVPTQTEITVSGADKQIVGQFASEIRAFRPPEPYKGKGIRYSDEHVVRKDAKKA